MNTEQIKLKIIVLNSHIQQGEEKLRRLTEGLKALRHKRKKLTRQLKRVEYQAYEEIPGREEE